MRKTQIYFLLVLLLVFGNCEKGKLKQASSLSTSIFSKVGEGFIELGNAEQIQSSNAFLYFLVTFGALLTVICMCVASQCVVEHVSTILSFTGKEMSETAQQLQRREGSIQSRVTQPLI